MKRTVMFGIECAMLSALACAEFASAGDNASAVATLSWTDSTGAPLGSDHILGTQARLLVTIRGLYTIKGIDVQIRMRACTQSPLPGAWLETPDSECPHGEWEYVYSAVNPLHPDLLKGISPLTVAYNGQCTDATCIDDPAGGLLRFSAFGTTGISRNPNTEYAAWSVLMALPVLDSAGCFGAGPPAEDHVDTMHFYPELQNQPYGFLRVAVYDTHSDVDFVLTRPAADHSLGVYWGTGTCDFSVRAKSWGHLRNLYR